MQQRAFLSLSTGERKQVGNPLQTNKAGRTIEHGQEFDSKENGVKKVLNQTNKRFGLELSGEPCENRVEQGEKPEWFRRFICFGIEKRLKEYLIVPFTNMQIHIKKQYK